MGIASFLGEGHKHRERGVMRRGKRAWTVKKMKGRDGESKIKEGDRAAEEIVPARERRYT